MVQPFFSVIITSFNRAKLLKKALDSLTKQTEEDWRAIIIDDGSTDKTKEVVLPFLFRYHNISYIFNHQNRGSGYSKNKGLKHSTGKYVTFLDSDDRYFPKHLSIRKKILTDNPGIDLLHGGVKIIGNPYVPDIENPGKLIHLDNCIIGGTLFVKREAALRIGGFADMRFGEDYDFYQRAIKNNLRILKTQEKTYVYHRDGEDSLCGNVNFNP